MNKIITKLGQLRKIVKKLDKLDDNTDITFEFLLTALFPSVWNNIQEEMRNQYTRGYLQGKEDSKNEQNKS
jgi:hypothetical protein